MLGARWWSKIITNKECIPFPFRPVRNFCGKKAKVWIIQPRTWLQFMLLINNAALKLLFSIWDWVCNHQQEKVGTFISFHIYILCKNVVNWKPHIFRVGGLIIHAVHFWRKWNFSDFIHILHPIQLFIDKRSQKSEINRYVIWRAFLPWVMNKCYHSKWSLK